MLLPPSLGEWLPEDHRAYFVSDVGTELDLTRIVKTYGGVTRRNAPYDPRRLVTILLYAYAGGIPASRRIARELDENVAFRVLAANQRPDFRTLSDFRKPHLAALTELFVQVLRRCQRAGWVTLGHIALDGTQLKANASKPKAMSDGRMGTDEARLKREVDALLQQAEAAEAQDDAAYGADRRGDELPAELARREQRRKTIRAAKAVLEQEAQADATLTPAAQNTGREPGHAAADRRRSPARGPPPKAQRNFTDPERRIMPERRGAWFKGTTVRRPSMRRPQSLLPPMSPMNPMTSSTPSRCCPRCWPTLARSPGS